MSVVDDLIENLVERNAIGLNGAFKVTLIDGGLKITGQAAGIVKDQKKGKDILHVTSPVEATVSISPVVIPLPRIP